YGHAASRRMQATHRRIRERLSPLPGVLFADEECVAQHQAACVACAFWEVVFLARGGGSLEDAEAAFAAAAQHRSDLGLLSARLDVADGQLQGAYPEAGAHLALITAAQSLAARRF